MVIVKFFQPPFAVFLNNDDKIYVEPDISVICDKSKLDDRGCNGAPDWVIEIVSPSSRSMDYLKKIIQISDCRCKGILDRRSYEKTGYCI